MNIASSGLALASLLSSASAQFGNDWLEFAPDDSALVAGQLSSADVETDLDWGDLDLDGWVDVVVARKQPYTTAGGRPNVLLMNEGGVLTDRTALYAASSDVPGDQGFLAPTNDRDILVADLTQDGWRDVVTATTLSDGLTKAVGHPRVYRNQAGAPGAWGGLRYEEARIPQLVAFATGLPRNPRFTEVAAGDMTGDGALDLWFVDHDSSGAGGAGQPIGFDLNDRMLVNDGSGYFADESLLRASTAMLESAYGTSVKIADMNGDGSLDVVKDSALNSPQNVRVLYNIPGSGGFFGAEQVAHLHAPYHVDVGDLNNDGRLDLVVGDDALDRYRFNLGNDPGGQVLWSAPQTFQFLSGSDDGFTGNVLIVDLDGDSWNDVLIADVDLDIPSQETRLNIYHNPGGAPGSAIELVEERQSDSGSLGVGWIGAKGLTASDMERTYDVAAFDIDNDGDRDLLLSRVAGTRVWRNLIPAVCQQDVGFGGPGSSKLTLCGEGLATGQASDVRLTGAAPDSLGFLVVGFQNTPTPIYAGLLVPIDLAGLFPLSTDAFGEYEFPGIEGGHGQSPTLYFQALVVNLAVPQLVEFSNAIKAQYMP